MQQNGSLAGPNPSTLEAVDDVPADKVPFLNLRVTYSTDSVSDWVGIHRSGRQVALELADPLLGIVSKLQRVNDLKKELEKAMKAIGIGGIVSEFNASVAEFANSFLPVNAFSPESIALSTAVYLLGKLYDAGMLMLGCIHQANMEELSSWMGLFAEAERIPDITVR